MFSMRIAALLAAVSGLAFADSWVGALVDSKCYAALERNRSPTDQLYNVDRDRGEEVLYCSPSVKTKAFGVVPRDGRRSFDLDAAGNAQAADLVAKAGKKKAYVVDVSGQRAKNTVTVDSLSLAK